MIVVSDSSPLILFSHIGALDLLRRVFREIVVPPAVIEEVVLQGENRPGSTELLGLPWITTSVPVNRLFVAELLESLDRGESEAIALACEPVSGATILLDDRRARQKAQQLGLQIHGSAGTLVLAKEMGVLPAVRPHLDDLRTAGLYLSVAAYRMVLAQAGE